MADMERHHAAMAKIESMFNPSVETPAEEPVETPEEPEQETVQAEGQETEATEQAESTQSQSKDEVEVEIDGEVFLMPKKIADSIERHADYTRKTQDLAEMRRAVSAEREAATLEKAFTDAVRQEQQELAALEAAIAQFKQLNWSAVEDTAQLLQLRTQFDTLRDRHADITKSIGEKRSEFDKKIKQAQSEAVISSRKVVESKIKGFDDGKRQELFAYLLTEGYTRDELDRLMDPRLVVSFWKARQWDNLQASAPSINKRATKAPPVVKPGGTKPQPSRIQALNKAIKQAPNNRDKVRAAEAYFTARFNGE